MERWRPYCRDPLPGRARDRIKLRCCRELFKLIRMSNRRSARIISKRRCIRILYFVDLRIVYPVDDFDLNTHAQTFMHAHAHNTATPHRSHIGKMDRFVVVKPGPPPVPEGPSQDREWKKYRNRQNPLQKSTENKQNPGVSWGPLGPPGASWVRGLLKPPGASWGFLGASWGFWGSWGVCLNRRSLGIFWGES